ncbi:MAG: DNA/RNA non-specific endonuclease, partial [Muribaculaceae bacterium]|nr:DNA/RNA non-specific endonuclease [Muribaculaceae bacterium]
PRTIGASRIPVPERFFKVILAPYANPPRGIAFIMPNSPQVDGLRQLATSIDNVEAITGFDFFSALPDTIENMVESTAKYNDWERSRR